jgi:Tol biopolymer transport system component
MRRVHIYTAILTLLLAIALVACGGSDAEAPTAAETAAKVAGAIPRPAAEPAPAPAEPTPEPAAPAVDEFAIEITADQRPGDIFAFASDRDGNLEIYTANIDGFGVARLTDDSADDRWPAFSPDGAYLAFSSQRTGDWATFLMRVDGSGQQQISGVAGSSDLYPAFSPDGTRLAVVRDEAELVVIELAAPFSAEVIHTGALGRAFWSPDGEYILVVDNEGRAATAVELDGTVREAGILFPCMANKDDNHAWTAYVIDNGAAGASAFGDVLAEPCTRKGLVNDLGGGSFMFVTRFDGSEVQTIIYLQSFIAVGFPAPSPDGTGLIYTRQAGDMVNTRDILILDLENPPERGQFGDLLTQNDFNDTDPAW